MDDEHDGIYVDLVDAGINFEEKKTEKVADEVRRGRVVSVNDDVARQR